MKNQKKGQNPSGRSRGRARETKETTAAGSSADPVTAPMSDGPATPAEVTTTPVSVESIPAAAEPVVEPALSAAPIPTTAAPGLRPGAERIVQEHLPLAVGAGMIPLPGVDLAAIGGLQLKVLASLAEHYKVPFTKAQAQLIVTSLLGSVGTTLLAGATLVSFAKIVPFFGTLVGAASMPVAGGVITLAMGHLAIDHFEAGGTMETFDLDVAQQAFLRKIDEAKVAFA